MKRRKSREVAFKLLYALELSGEDSKWVLDSFDTVIRKTDADMSAPEIWDYAVKVFNWTVDMTPVLDEKLPALIPNWSIKRLSRVDKVMIYMGCAEMTSGAEPYEVVINEILELSKSYGGLKSAAFINGVLDSWRKNN